MSKMREQLALEQKITDASVRPDIHEAMRRNYESQLTAANEENFKFRQALWLLNGDVGKYGDDGEMQSLGVDYKRGDADRIIRTTTKEIQKTTGKLTQANARLEEAERVIEECAKFIKAVYAAISSKEYVGVWSLYLAHGGKYEGPTYDATLASKAIESYQSQKGGKG
jgi:hypothetical protein